MLKWQRIFLPYQVRDITIFCRRVLDLFLFHIKNISVVLNAMQKDVILDAHVYNVMGLCHLGYFMWYLRPETLTWHLFDINID